MSEHTPFLLKNFLKHKSQGVTWLESSSQDITKILGKKTNTNPRVLCVRLSVFK